MRASIVRRRAVRGVCGVSLVEALTAAFVMGLLSLMCFGVVNTALHSVDRDSTRLDMTGKGRLSLDEMTYHLRGASSVVTNKTIGSRTYVTNTANLLIELPSYNVSEPGVFLSSTYDYAAFRYDTTAKTLTETVSVAAGSQRRSRSEYVLARNVAAVRYKYWITDQFSTNTTTASSFTKTLTAPANATPQALVNGVPVSCTYSSSLNQATVSVPSGASNVQFTYPLRPANVTAANMVYINRVDLEVEMSQADSRQIQRTYKIAGSACLRGHE